VVYTLFAKKYGADKDYTQEIAAEVLEQQQIIAYQTDQAIDDKPFIHDTSGISKLLNAVSVISLLIITGFACQVMFFSESMHIYDVNKTQFELYCFICTITYFGSAYMSLKRQKALNS
jgi:NCS1 family nucleobase:cation symporter-1